MIARSKTAVRAGTKTELPLSRRNYRDSGRVLVSYRAVLHGRAFRPNTLNEPEAASLYERRMVLVRPDGMVAWRGNLLPDDAVGLVDRVRGALVAAPRTRVRETAAGS